MLSDSVPGLRLTHGGSRAAGAGLAGSAVPSQASRKPPPFPLQIYSLPAGSLSGLKFFQINPRACALKPDIERPPAVRRGTEAEVHPGWLLGAFGIGVGSII